ncbi:ROK family transcriptional regulator [Luedemannella flava]|uniref:ROK family transcriptional regulator n=1 Tax=Luedemannella flava TaxID=349316 RepID=UPI0031DBCB3B
MTVRTTAVDSPVRQHSLREHNLALVLRRVATNPRPLSRADVAAATGLTRATVSTLVDDLVAGGLLAELEPVPRAGVGRPATGLALSPHGPCGLGLEINVDYLAACVTDLSGTVRHQIVRHVDQRDRPAGDALAAVAELAAEAADVAAAEGLPVAGAALAVPGLVRQNPHGGGHVHVAPNLGWRDVPVPAALGALTLRVENEANLAALGELQAGEQDPDVSPSFIYVSGEVGIGAGIVLDGQLYRGAHGWSGEFGHLTIDANGPRCHCGARGCLEQYAGQDAILRAAGVAGEDAVPAGLERIQRLAQAADPAMLAALGAAGAALGIALAGAVNLLDVDAVVLGGSYAPLAPWLRAAVEEELTTRVITAGWSPAEVRASALGPEATVVGAAGSVVRDVLAHPAAWLATLS